MADSRIETINTPATRGRRAVMIGYAADDLNSCMETCRHARKCFEENKDPDAALKILVNKYCDYCMFAEQEED